MLFIWTMSFHVQDCKDSKVQKVRKFTHSLLSYKSYGKIYSVLGICFSSLILGGVSSPNVINIPIIIKNKMSISVMQL